MNLNSNNFLEKVKLFYKKNKIKVTTILIFSCCLYFLLLRSYANPLVTFNEKKMTEDEKNEILDLSNAVRRKCNKNLEMLTWNEELEEYATKTATYLANARGCALEHATSYQDIGAGENLARTVNAPNPIKTAVNLWSEEGYDGSYNHYTAMNWKDASEIGCGMSKSSCGVVIACNYRSGKGRAMPNLFGYFDENVLCNDPIYV